MWPALHGDRPYDRSARRTLAVPLVGWIVGALEVAAVGGATGVLAAALASIGIPQDSMVKYEVALKSGKFLVLARGGPELTERAQTVLGATGPSHLAAHA